LSISNKWYHSFGYLIVNMLSVKYDLPLLNWDTRFSLWQVKMQAVLSQTNLDNALDDFGKKDVKYYYV
jgi:hypothetical protein